MLQQPAFQKCGVNSALDLDGVSCKIVWRMIQGSGCRPIISSVLKRRLVGNILKYLKTECNEEQPIVSDHRENLITIQRGDPEYHSQASW